MAFIDYAVRPMLVQNERSSADSLSDKGVREEPLMIWGGGGSGKSGKKKITR